MRKAFIATFVAAILIGGVVLTNAAIRSRTNDRVTGPAAGLIRSTKYWEVGPGASYDFDSGNIFTVNALRLTFPAGTTYDAVVTMTLDYRTSPDDRFIAALVLREGAQFGPIIVTVPHARPVQASTVRTATTATFRLSRLTGGTEYWLSPVVNVSHRDDHASIDSQHVLMIVDATQAT